MRGLRRLSGLELRQLADRVVGQSPMRQVAWCDLAPLCVPHRLHELLLDRLLIAHCDLRALLGVVEPSVLTRLRVTRIRCTCQAERNVGSGLRPGLGEACATQSDQDVERLAILLAQAKFLQELDTDMPVNVRRLSTSGPYEALKLLRLVRFVSPSSPGARPMFCRYFLSKNELTSLLQQMPALRELRCDASQAIGWLEEAEMELLARLEVVHLLHEVAGAKTSREEPFAPGAQFLVAHCPNVRELVFRVARPGDLRPLCALRHLERLCLCYGGRGGRAFLDESLLDALGDTATNLRHLDLPTEAHLRPQVDAGGRLSGTGIAGSAVLPPTDQPGAGSPHTPFNTCHHQASVLAGGGRTGHPEGRRSADAAMPRAAHHHAYAAAHGSRRRAAAGRHVRSLPETRAHHAQPDGLLLTPHGCPLPATRGTRATGTSLRRENARRVCRTQQCGCCQPKSMKTMHRYYSYALMGNYVLLGIFMRMINIRLPHW
ncbi:uncharacterized protein LOC142807379 isoform X1 [Rhipicephalus microplus]|uniref:uncharacterized protein LOC142807379 isoform X1 n=1 Tax=Rhipicephalus microplus TaxID=6941 RepID=UPI003F6A913A